MKTYRCGWAACTAALVVLTFPIVARAGTFDDGAAAKATSPALSIPYLLAQAAEAEESEMPAGGGGLEQLRLNGDPEEKPWKPRRFTANKVHKYLGLASLGAATVAALSTGTASQDDPKSGLHHYAAASAAYLGGGAVLTGLVFHWGDYRLRDGFLDPDNLHALLGMIGTAGYAMALDSAPKSEHQDAGAAGIAAMLISIKIAW